MGELPARYALLGTGHMGTALGAALLDNGKQLTVWNRSPERAEPLLAQGASWAHDAATAIAEADLVIACLLNTATTFDVLDDPSVRDRLRGKTLVEVSTGSPEDAGRLTAWAAESGAELLVAFVKAYPRDIGTEHTEVHLAGSAEAFERHRSTLACWGRTHFAGADVSAATARNTAGILMMFSLVTGFLEGAAYARSHGVTPAEVQELLPVSFRLANAAIRRATQVSAGGGSREPEATLDVYVHAMRGVVETIAATGLRSRVGEAALGLLSEAVGAGHGDADLDVLLDDPGTARRD